MHMTIFNTQKISFDIINSDIALSLLLPHCCCLLKMGNNIYNKGNLVRLIVVGQKDHHHR